MLEAHYLAQGLATWICTLSPKLILIGGGVAEQSQLFPLMRNETAMILNGYVGIPEIRAPELGARAGVLGAIALAETALAAR